MENELNIEIINNAIDSLIDVSSEIGICQSEISDLLMKLNLEKSKLEQ